MPYIGQTSPPVIFRARCQNPMTDRIHALEATREIVSRANLFFLLQTLAGKIHIFERSAMGEPSASNEQPSIGQNALPCNQSPPATEP